MIKILGVFGVIGLFVYLLVGFDQIYKNIKGPEETFKIERFEQIMNDRSRFTLTVVPKQQSTIFSVTVNDGNCKKKEITVGPTVVAKGSEFNTAFTCSVMSSVEIHTDKGSYIYDY